jgi:hypothetical protein
MLYSSPARFVHRILKRASFDVLFNAPAGGEKPATLEDAGDVSGAVRFKFVFWLFCYQMVATLKK